MSDETRRKLTVWGLVSGGLALIGAIILVLVIGGGVAWSKGYIPGTKAYDEAKVQQELKRQEIGAKKEPAIEYNQRLQQQQQEALQHLKEEQEHSERHAKHANKG